MESRRIPELTHKNHFVFGYNGVPFSWRQSPEDQWYVEYGRCERAPLSFGEECLKTARLIRENTDEELVVLLSGGVDSEIVLRSFQECGIKVRAATVQFGRGYNRHDIYWAFKACQSMGIPLEIYELDVEDFWTSQAREYAEPIYCISPELLSSLWLIDQVKGYPIVGSGECLCVKQVAEDYQPNDGIYTHSPWDLWALESLNAWYRHLIRRNRSGCPAFFHYTAEIIVSFLLDPVVQELVNNKVYGKLSTSCSKLKIYQQYFKLRERPKYTGFEFLEEQVKFLRKKLRSEFPSANQVYKTPVKDLTKMSSEINQLSPTE